MKVIVGVLLTLFLLSAGLAVHEHIAAVTQYKRAVAAEVSWKNATDQYNKLADSLNKRCKPVAADADQASFPDKMSCFYGAMADARDKGASEQEVRKQMAELFTPDTDQPTRDFMYSTAHELFANLSQMNRYEVAGAVYIGATVFEQMHNGK